MANKTKWKISIFGCVGLNHSDISGGQEVKTRAFYEHFCQKIGSENVGVFDTKNWKKHFILNLFRAIKLIRESEKLVMLPAHKGLFVFTVLFRLFKRKNSLLIYLVIGGWLPNMVKKHHLLKRLLLQFDFIFVETHKMENQLKKLGFCNTHYLPNTKHFKSLSISAVRRPDFPLQVCTFSRVIPEKGIEEAIKIVQKANEDAGTKRFNLTIFGNVPTNQQEWFNSLRNKYSNYFTYGGLIDTNNTQDVLTKFDILLLLTKFKTEGFPGTILDAYASGLLLITSDLEQMREIVNKDNGFLVDPKNESEVVHILQNLTIDQIVRYKATNLKEIEKYSSEKIFQKFDLLCNIN